MNANEIVMWLRQNNRKSGWTDIDRMMDKSADLIESLQAQLSASQRRADAAVECIEKIDDWNNHFCYHDLEEIIDEWRGVKEEREWQYIN